MNEELVTVKKEKAPIIQLIATVIVVIFMAAIAETNGIIYALSIACIAFAISYGSLFLRKTITALKDTEKFVVVNRNSLKNKEAEAFLRENAKITRKNNLIKAIIFAVIVSATMTYISYNIPVGPKRTAAIILSFVVAYAVYIYFDINTRKILAKRNKTIVSMCDPEYMYELSDQIRTQIITDLEKSITLYIQAMASYYMDDYDTMFLKIEKIGEVNKNKSIEILSAGLQGAACIKTGNADGYNDAYEMVYSLQDENANNKELHSLCDTVTKRLNVQLGLAEGTPDKVLDQAVEAVNEAKDYELFRMEYTFILAELQEMAGLTELAQANYKTVAEYAGKMKIRDIAAGRLAR